MGPRRQYCQPLRDQWPTLSTCVTLPSIGHHIGRSTLKIPRSAAILSILLAGGPPATLAGPRPPTHRTSSQESRDKTLRGINKVKLTNKHWVRSPVVDLPQPLIAAFKMIDLQGPSIEFLVSQVCPDFRRSWLAILSSNTQAFQPRHLEASPGAIALIRHRVGRTEVAGGDRREAWRDNQCKDGVRHMCRAVAPSHMRLMKRSCWRRDVYQELFWRPRMYTPF